MDETAAAETTVSDATPSSDVPVSTPVDDDPYDFDAPGYETPVETPAETPPTDPALQTSGEGSAAPTVAQPAVSAALAQRAAAAGFTPETIAAINNPIALEASVRTAEQAAMNAAMFMQQRFQQQAQFAQPAQQQIQAPAAPTPPPPFNEQEYRDALTKEGYHDHLANTLVENKRGLHAQAQQNYEHAKAIYDQQKYNYDVHQFMLRRDAEVAQMRQQHQQELIGRDYSAFAASLPENQQKLVNDPTNKAQIYQMANAMLSGMAASGQPLPSNQDAFKMATHAVLADKLHGAAVEEVRQRVVTHQNRAIARPAASRSAAPTRRSPDERVAAAGSFADQFYRELGIPTVAGGTGSPEV